MEENNRLYTSKLFRKIEKAIEHQPGTAMMNGDWLSLKKK